MVYIQYSCRRITHAPRECAGFTRGFAIPGLDKILWFQSQLRRLDDYKGSGFFWG